MKKLGIVIGLVTLAAMATQSLADVQNIRLSGDIRVRGYYFNNASLLKALESEKDVEDSFITQRTRVSLEADLEDHVLVVVGLRAEGVWGSYNESLLSSAGAGLPLGPLRVNRGFDVGIHEAFVQVSEMFYTPLTLKLGRQYLHYGRGLILSGIEQEYNYDAARAILDFYPLTVDVVYAKGYESSVPSFGGGIGLYTLTGDNRGDVDMFFVNSRYEFTDSLIKNLELYVGHIENHADLLGLGTIPWMPATIAGASSTIIGLRGDLNLTESLQTWFEGAYQCGADGRWADEQINAYLVNVGGKFSLQNRQWSPAVNASYTHASGGGRDERGYFRPWMDYTDGYNGYLFHPLLSNIHIFNVGGSLKPAENTSLALQAYYYLKADRDGFVLSNPNIGSGLTGIYSLGNDTREVGWEIDAILGYDYSKDVRCQLVYAAFLPDKAVREQASFLLLSQGGIDAVAHMVRGEINVKF